MKLKLGIGVALILFLLTSYFVRPNKIPVVATDTPYLQLSAADSYSGSAGLINFSSITEPKVDIYAYQAFGPAKIEIYNVTLNDILNFLTHDNKYYQLNDKVDTSKFSHLLDTNLSQVENSKSISLPLPETGLFYIQVVQNNLKSGSFVIRSSIGTMAREAKDTLVLWTQNFKTKRSVSDTKVAVYNLEKSPAIVFQTNSDNVGIASIPLANSADIVVTEGNNSISITPLNARYLNNYHYWNPFQPNTIQKRFFVFTDRPIYQPGDKVYFKAIVRDDNDARYSFTQDPVLVSIGPAYDNVNFFYKNKLSVDSNGFITGSYTLAKNIKAGDYKITLNPKTISSEWGEYQGSDDSIYFKVENYRKPEYFLSSDSSQMVVVRGDTININISGQYYSGQPLSNSVVNYKIYSDQNNYSDYEYYYPTTGTNYFRPWNGSEVESNTVTLDKKGKATVSISTNKNDSAGKNQIYFVEFTYADASGNQALTGVSTMVKSGDYSIYRDRDNYVYGGKVGEKIDIPFIIKSNRPGISLLQKVEINTVRHSWEKYIDVNSKYPQYKDINEDLGIQTINSNNNGSLTYSLTPQKEGSYEINCKVVDTKGNIITKKFYLWISNQYSAYYGNYQSQSNIKITTDKSSYRVGDEAQIHINSEIPDSDVFLGIERAYQDRYQVLHLNGNSIDVPLKIVDHDLPNIYLAAKSFTNNTLEGDIQNLTVDTSGKKINYELNTDKSVYAPGDEVTVNVSAKDSGGNPIETNFALWSVDKSIYALSDLNYGDIFQRFWDNRSDETQQAHSLENILTGGGAEKGGCFSSTTKILMSDDTLKPISDVKVGDKIKTHLSAQSSQMVTTTVSAIHQTTAPGYLVINNQLNITDNHLIFVNNRWITARAIKIGDKLTGVDDKKITVVSLEYVQASDQVYNLTTDIYHTFIADGIYVHNEKGGSARDNFADTAYWNASVNTNSQGTAQIKFKLPDNLTTWVITIIGSSFDTKVGQSFTEIKVSKDLVIRPVLPNILGDGDNITISALVHNFTNLDTQTTVKLVTDAGQVSDSLIQKTMVRANDYSQVNWRIKVGQNKSNAKFEFAVTDGNQRSDTVIQSVPIRTPGYWSQKSDFKSGSSTIELNTPTDDFDPTKTLLELNLSPNVFGSLPSAMKYLINYSYGCVEQTTSSLVSKLVAQKYSTLFADALKNVSKSVTIDDGLDRLYQLQNSDGSWSWWWQGSKAEPFISAYVFRILNFARSLGYTVDESMYSRAQKFLSNNYEQSDLESKIIKAYGLSFSPDSKLHYKIESDFSNLSDDFLAMVVYSNYVANFTDATKNGLDLLVSRAQVDDTGAHWNSGLLDRFGSVEASTSLAIQALTKSGQQTELTAKAINYLVKSRYHDYWGSTYTTAQTIMAIVGYSPNSNDVKTTTNYRIMAGNTLLSNGKFLNQNANSIDLTIDPKKVPKNTPITIEKTGDGSLYSTLNQKWWIKDAKSREVSQGVTITKTITNEKGSEYNFVPGDLVRVNIRVDFPNSDSRLSGYGLLEDHLPSGLVPVNTNLLNEATTGSNSYYQPMEYLKDGVIIPVYYNNFTNNYIYLARVVNSGTFYNPPAFYTLMYYPEVWGRSASSTFTVDNTVKVSPMAVVKQTVSSINQPKNKNAIVLAVVLIVGVVFLVIRKIRVKKANSPKV